MCCGASRAPLGRGSRVENKMFCAVVNTATYSCLVDVLLRVGGSLCFFELWTTLRDAAVLICRDIIGNVNKSSNLRVPVEFLRSLLLLFPPDFLSCTHFLRYQVCDITAEVSVGLTTRSGTFHLLSHQLFLCDTLFFIILPLCQLHPSDLRSQLFLTPSPFLSIFHVNPSFTSSDHETLSLDTYSQRGPVRERHALL